MLYFVLSFVVFTSEQNIKNGFHERVSIYEWYFGVYSFWIDWVLLGWCSKFEKWSLIKILMVNIWQKKRIIDTLKSKWISDLLDSENFVNLADRECEEFDPTKFYDSEKYMEKLVKVGQLFKKNSKKGKKDLLSRYVGDCYFFLFLVFFYLLNSGDHCILNRNYFCICICVFF